MQRRTTAHVARRQRSAPEQLGAADAKLAEPAAAPAERSVDLLAKERAVGREEERSAGAVSLGRDAARNASRRASRSTRRRRTTRARRTSTPVDRAPPMSRARGRSPTARPVAPPPQRRRPWGAGRRAGAAASGARRRARGAERPSLQATRRRPPGVERDAATRASTRRPARRRLTTTQSAAAAVQPRRCRHCAAALVAPGRGRATIARRRCSSRRRRSCSAARRGSACPSRADAPRAPSRRRACSPRSPPSPSAGRGRRPAATASRSTPAGAPGSPSSTPHAAGRWQPLGVAPPADGAAARDGATTRCDSSAPVGAAAIVAPRRHDACSVDAAPAPAPSRWQATLVPAGAERLRSTARRACRPERRRVRRLAPPRAAPLSCSVRLPLPMPSSVPCHDQPPARAKRAARSPRSARR